EHGPRQPAFRSPISALLPPGGDPADERGRPRLVLLLPYSGLPPEVRAVRALLFGGRRGVHDALVEPDAAVRWPFRLPEHRPTGLLRLQAAIAVDRRPSAAGVDRNRDSGIGDARRQVPNR